MKVALTVNDFLRRAEEVYPDRVGVVDEPDQPAPSWGSLTYREVAERARAQAAGLDALGLDPGDRVAIVSQNSARLLTSFWGVAGSGRVLVPVNFRLNADEVGYIVDHSGARVVLVDPELDDALSGVKAEHRYVLGAATDEELLRYGVEPRPWAGDEDATATINYTSGTTARPKGVQLTHRNCWLNATQFGWHMGVTDRDVYLHTLPMFHANGWGMPFAVTGMGGRHIVLRKVDGPEILRRIEAYGVTLMCGAPAVAAAVLDAAAGWDGPVPGHGTLRMAVAGAPPPTRTIERLETELGWEFVQVYGLTETAPILTMARRRGEWDGLSATERAVKLGRAGAPVLGVEVATTDDGEVLAREQRRDGGLLEPARGHRRGDPRRMVPHRRRRLDRRRALRQHLGPHQGRHHLGRRERQLDRGGGRAVPAPRRRRGGRDRRPPREVGGDRHGARGAAAGTSATEADLIEFCRQRLAHYKCPTTIELRTELARTATGKLQKFKLREGYWAGRDKRIN